MPCTTTFYESSNGDKWLLARDPATDRVFVQHQANLPSGGHVTHIEVSRFLALDAAGPEHEALRRLVDEASEQTSRNRWPPQGISLGSPPAIAPAARDLRAKRAF